MPRRTADTCRSCCGPLRCRCPSRIPGSERTAPLIPPLDRNGGRYAPRAPPASCDPAHRAGICGSATGSRGTSGSPALTSGGPRVTRSTPDAGPRPHHRPANRHAPLTPTFERGIGRVTHPGPTCSQQPQRRILGAPRPGRISSRASGGSVRRRPARRHLRARAGHRRLRRRVHRAPGRGRAAALHRTPRRPCLRAGRPGSLEPSGSALSRGSTRLRARAVRTSAR